MGGRAAEQVLLQTMTAGASNDIERAVEIARRMVSEFGMSRLGPIHLGQPDQPHSQTMLDRIEDWLGHRRECSGSNRFRRRNRGDLENRLHDFRLRNRVDGFGVSRFDAYWLHLLELIMEGFRRGR